MESKKGPFNVGRLGLWVWGFPKSLLTLNGIQQNDPLCRLRFGRIRPTRVTKHMSDLVKEELVTSKRQV